MNHDANAAEVAAWVVEHHAELYRYAFRLCGSSTNAEDLTQQTYLSALAGRREDQRPEKVRPWLFAILRHAWIKTLRKPLLLAEDHELPLESLAEEEDESPIDSERLQIALDGLSRDLRLILVMSFFEELSYREIATALSIPLGTVMSRLSRAKAALRCRLQELERPALSPAGVSAIASAAAENASPAPLNTP